MPVVAAFSFALVGLAVPGQAQVKTFEVLHRFEPNAFPSAPVIQGADGALYGTTESGGAMGHGSLFRYDPSTSTVAILQSFDGTNGSLPEAALLLGADGALYGTTHGGVRTARGRCFDTTSRPPR